MTDASRSNLDEDCGYYFNGTASGAEFTTTLHLEYQLGEQLRSALLHVRLLILWTVANTCNAISVLISIGAKNQHIILSNDPHEEN